MGCITRDDCTDIVERYPESTLNAYNQDMCTIPRIGQGAPLYFARNETIRDATHAGAAIPLDRRPEESELAHRRQDVMVEF